MKITNNIDNHSKALLVVLIPLLIALAVIAGYKTFVATLIFLTAWASYFFCFLYLVLAIKERSLTHHKTNLAIYAITSVSIYFLSFYFYGFSFTVKALIIALISGVITGYSIIKS